MPRSYRHLSLWPVFWSHPRATGTSSYRVVPISGGSTNGRFVSRFQHSDPHREHTRPPGEPGRPVGNTLARIGAERAEKEASSTLKL